MDIHYGCTQCGVCCLNIKIPLTTREARSWLDDGNQVQIVCEASSWLTDRSADDPRAAHVKRRSFAAMSGAVPVRIVAMLVANLVGDCPNLLPDMRCGIYQRRPLVCRIYPAEINPVIQFSPGKKACPPEAWTADRPVFMRDGRAVDEEVRRDVAQWRETDAREVEIRRRMCAVLEITDSAVAQEGFVVYSPTPSALSAALASAASDAADPPAGDWRFVTDRPETLDALRRSGAVGRHSSDMPAMQYQYIGLKRTQTEGS